jgi:hypothetical protein
MNQRGNLSIFTHLKPKPKAKQYLFFSIFSNNEKQTEMMIFQELPLLSFKTGLNLSLQTSTFFCFESCQLFSKSIYIRNDKN